jgi:uncharacterized membrane protein YbhN (UPF0104 family)
VDDVRAVFDALEAFFSHLSAVSWVAVGIAVGFHLGRLALRVPAWRNIIRAAYPGRRVPLGSLFAAYMAGVGINSIAPARAGDVVKLTIAKRGVQGSSYPTLASTLVVETIFDFAVATFLFLVAIALGLLPGLPDLPALPAFDWRLVVEQPALAAVLASILAGAALLGIAYASHHVRRFWEEVREGFAILGDRRAFVRRVVTWQAASWVARFLSVYFFLRAFHIDATFETTLAVIVVQSLTTLLPFTPGGIGPQQAVLVFVLAGTASASAVLSFSVGMHVITVAANVAVGFAAIGLTLRTLRWRGLAPGGPAPEPAVEPSRTTLPG